MATPDLLAAYAEAHNAKTPGDPTAAARAGLDAVLTELATYADACIACGKAHERRWIPSDGESIGHHTWASTDDGHAYRHRFNFQGGAVAEWLRSLREAQP